MKKFNLFALLFLVTSLKSQCTISDLTLDLLGKNKYDAKNILFSDKTVSDMKEDNNAINTDFGYLTKEHKKSFINFKKSTNGNCFAEDSSPLDYSIKMVDDKIYSISISKEYIISNFEDFQSNYDNLEVVIFNDYPEIASGYHLFRKFNNEDQKTGESTYFSNEKIVNKNSIWKVNQVMLSKENIYEYDYKNLVNKNNQTGFQIKLQFTNLNNTVLDNRGY